MGDLPLRRRTRAGRTLLLVTVTLTSACGDKSAPAGSSASRPVASEASSTNPLRSPEASCAAWGASAEGALPGGCARWLARLAQQDGEAYACTTRCENPRCAENCVESRGADFARQEKIVVGWPDLPITVSWGSHVGMSGAVDVGYSVKFPDGFHPDLESETPGTKSYVFTPTEAVPKADLPVVEVSFIAPDLIADAVEKETKTGKRVASKAAWRHGEITVVASEDERDIRVSTFTKLDEKKGLRCNASVVDSGVVGMHRDKIEPWLIKLCTPSDLY